MLSDLESLNRTYANLLVHDSELIEKFDCFTSQMERFNYGKESCELCMLTFLGR